MASHQAARRAALALLTALAVGAAGCGRREFRVSGTITIASHLRTRVPKENVVMFIVAKNLGGVPVAFKRIVNPQFPVTYTLGMEDLVVPGTRPKDALNVSVEMNIHGNLGTPEKGDLFGAHHDRVTSPARRVHIVIDHRL